MVLLKCTDRRSNPNWLFRGRSIAGTQSFHSGTRSLLRVRRKPPTVAVAHQDQRIADKKMRTRKKTRTSRISLRTRPEPLRHRQRQLPPAMELGVGGGTAARVSPSNLAEQHQHWPMPHGPKHNGPSRATHTIDLPQAAIKRERPCASCEATVEHHVKTTVRHFHTVSGTQCPAAYASPPTSESHVEHYSYAPCPTIAMIR